MQVSEFSIFLLKIHTNIKDPSLPLPSKCLQVSEILSFLLNNLVLNPIPSFTETGLLPDLFKLKGYDRDYELIDLIFHLIASASRSGMKSLLEIDILNFIFSFIPHRKSKVMGKVAFILGKLAGVSLKVREEILQSGNVGLLINLLAKENNPKIVLNLSYLIYKCSYDLCSGFLNLFVPCFEFVRLLMISQEGGVVLGNCYETIHNIAQCRENEKFIRRFPGIENDLLISFGKWSGGSLHITNILPNEENLVVCFLKLMVDFVRIYDDEFIKLGISRYVFDRLVILLIDDGSSVQKYMITLFQEIYSKDLSIDECFFFIQMKGMLKWMEKALQNDRKDKFSLCLDILHQSIFLCGVKLGLKISSQSKVFRILAECYELLVSKERRLQILGILHIYVNSLLKIGNKKENNQIFNEPNRELMLDLNRICKIFRDEVEETESLLELKTLVREYLKMLGFLLDSEFKNLKI